MAVEPPDPDALRSLALLEGVSPAHLAAVSARLGLVRAEPGEVVLREGDPGDTFSLLVEGEITVSRAGPSGMQHLADVRAGSIVGELAVLRHQPRTATLTARTPALLAIGDAAALRALLDIPAVFARIRRLASTRLAGVAQAVPASLRDGTPVVVRPLLPEDREAFGRELRQLSPESRRRRFFSPGLPSEAMVDYLVDIDYVDHFAWLTLDGSDPSVELATARYVRSGDPAEAEMGFTTVDAYQGRGLGTFLLGAIGVAAVEAGIEVLAAHVLDDNRAMKAVFAKASPHASFEEAGVLRYEIDPAAAAALLDATLRRQLAAAVHDVVTAASLALAHPAGADSG
jgi:CRP-like cAMP-binding protein